MNNHWEISMGNRVTTTNIIYKAYVLELCGRQLEDDMLALDTREYDVVIDMTLLSKHRAIFDCRKKKVIFRIPYQPEFQFI